jgi:hypothetical protein
MLKTFKKRLNGGSMPDCAETLLETKYNVYRGWLIPYLINGDLMFNNARWLFWLRCLKDRHIPNEELPRITFIPSSGDSKVLAVRKHIEKAIDYIAYKTGEWDALQTLMEWLLWGLGQTGAEFPRLNEEQHMWLYKYFQLGLLQDTPHDYWGDIIAERKGNGDWNRNAFYPTPENIVQFMTEMTVGDPDEKGIFRTALDPCLGSGRFAMYLSNKLIFIYGNDIDHVVIKAALINMNLYAPWVALPAEPRNEPPYYYIPDSAAHAAEARLIVAGQMYDEFKQHARVSKMMEEIRTMLKEPGKKKASKLSLPDTVSQPVQADNESQNVEEGESQLALTL